MQTKKHVITGSVINILFVGLLLTSCKTDEPSPVEKNTKLLTSGTWSVSYVKVDGIDRTDLFQGLKITFSDTGYTAENGGPIWGSASSWLFADNAATAFEIADDVMVSINELNASLLNVTLMWTKTTLDGGRERSVDGVHEFQFVK